MSSLLKYITIKHYAPQLPTVELCDECQHAYDDHARCYEYNEDGIAVAMTEPCVVPSCDCRDFQFELGLDVADAEVVG